MDVSDRDVFEVGDLGHAVSPEDEGQGNSVLGDNALFDPEPYSSSGWFGNVLLDSVYEPTPPLVGRLR